MHRFVVLLLQPTSCVCLSIGPADIAHLPTPGNMNESRIFASIQSLGDYFDDCNPVQPIYASDDSGASWHAYQPASEMTNHKVHSLLAYDDACGGQVCAATDGTGLQCVNASFPLETDDNFTTEHLASV